MFSDFGNSVNVDFKYSFNESEVFDRVSKLEVESRIQYGEAQIELTARYKELARYEEQLLVTKNERIKVMSESASYAEIIEDLKKTDTDLNRTLKITELSLKKYSIKKPETMSFIKFTNYKKIFEFYKHNLNMYFDIDNGPILSGYVFEKGTKKITYFKINRNEQTADEIAKYMYDKIKSVSIL